jgi:hypothetical protein
VEVKADPQVEQALIVRAIDRAPRSRLDIRRTLSYTIRTSALQDLIKEHIEKIAVGLAQESVSAAVQIALSQINQAELARADAALTSEALAVTTDQLREAEQRYADQEDLIRNRSNYEDDLNRIGERFYDKAVGNYADLIHATELGLRECLNEAVGSLREIHETSVEILKIDLKDAQSSPPREFPSPSSDPKRRRPSPSDKK